jgi:outer membrane lipoprotein-sorting protein
MSINPYLVLQDNSSFDTSLGNTLKLDGKDVYEILLVEKEKDNELDMISIIVDVKTYRPLKVTLVFNGNQINSFIIKNYKTGQEFSDLIFVCPLSSFSEADIIDMR